ncbi:hypothetical protein SO180_05655 [Bradyrhizobium sp. UFLA05-112]
MRSEFGHFAEWLLAASYHTRGHAIGYLEEARVHHYYIGRLDELEMFTRDFVEGEIRYLSEGRREPGSELLEIPVEWSRQDNFDPALARRAFGALVLDGRSWSKPTHETWRGFRRWIGPALFGDLHSRSAARFAAAYDRCVLTVLTRVGSRESVARWMKRYIAALIDFQRLESIHRVRNAKGAPLQRLGDPVLAQAGFNAAEIWQGRAFRWSEPEAAVRISARPGRNVVRVQCLNVRGPLDRIGLRFYLDGARIADRSIAIQEDGFELRLQLPSSGESTLAWTCPRFAAAGDPRRLGLPVVAIEVTNDVQPREA